MSADQPLTADELATIRARAEAAAINSSGHRWTLDEQDTAVRANRGAGPTVCTMIPLGVDIQRANAAHIAGMDPATTLRLVAEIERLQRWKAEALPVMAGLQELGGALGLPLGTTITGREAADAALDLHNEVRRLRAITGEGPWDPNALIYGVGP